MTIPVLSYRSSKGGVRVDLDVLVRSRMLIQANSGGGKSWALRQLLEETFGKVQHIVLDPEGEYSTLRESFDYLVAAKHGADAEATPRTAKVLCRRLMETSASAVIDLYDLDLSQRREFVKIFLTELLSLPKDLRRPLLVVLDEAHKFAPEGAKSEALEAVVTLASQGRKRGYALVCATQRLSKLSKDVAAELNTKLIGRTGLDLDVKRAGDELGMDKDERAKLPMLEPGTFYVYGPAIIPAGAPRVVVTGAVKTTHPEPGAIEALTPPPSARVKALLAEAFADLPQQATEEARTVETLQKQNAELQRKLRSAERVQPSVPAKIVEKTVVDHKAIERAVEAAVKPWRRHNDGIRRVLERTDTQLRMLTDYLASAPVAPDEAADRSAGTPNRPERPLSSLGSPALRAPQKSVDPIVAVSGNVPRPQQRILDTIAQFETLGVEQPTRSNIGAFLGVSSSTGSFKNYLGALKSGGYITYPTDGQVALTDEGRAIANPSTGPQSLAELHKIWFDKLPRPQAKILRIVVDVHPDSITRSAIGAIMGVSHETGSFKNYLGALRSLGLIDYPADGEVIATKLLFPAGMR